MSEVSMIDTDGKRVTVDESELYLVFVANNMTFFGMTADHIITLKQLYDTMGGTEPVTEESIQKLIKNL